MTDCEDATLATPAVTARVCVHTSHTTAGVVPEVHRTAEYGNDVPNTGITTCDSVMSYNGNSTWSSAERSVKILATKQLMLGNAQESATELPAELSDFPFTDSKLTTTPVEETAGEELIRVEMPA